MLGNHGNLFILGEYRKLQNYHHQVNNNNNFQDFGPIGTQVIHLYKEIYKRHLKIRPLYNSATTNSLIEAFISMIN